MDDLENSMVVGNDWEEATIVAIPDSITVMRHMNREDATTLFVEQFAESAGGKENWDRHILGMLLCDTDAETIKRELMAMVDECGESDFAIKSYLGEA